MAKEIVIERPEMTILVHKQLVSEGRIPPGHAVQLYACKQDDNSEVYFVVQYWPVKVMEDDSSTTL